MKPALLYLAPILAVAVAGAGAYFILTRSTLPVFESLRACSTPLAYGIGAYDPRFGISEEEFSEAIEEAVAVWNTSAGRKLFASSTLPSVTVALSYDERQQAVELGDTISAEQQNYEEMQEAIELLRTRYSDLQSAYTTSLTTFEVEAASYEQEVAKWNAQGGAPPVAYARLALRKAALEERQADLNRQATLIQSVGRDINVQVDRLNVLVRRLNTNAETFNETLGHDFDQGNYVSTDTGGRITIFTFESKEELTRVLVHEFGHALGIGHVENPDSIMYSYSIGQSLELSEEDRAALTDVCDL